MIKYDGGMFCFVKNLSNLNENMVYIFEMLVFFLKYVYLIYKCLLSVQFEVGLVLDFRDMKINIIELMVLSFMFWQVK